VVSPQVLVLRHASIVRVRLRVCTHCWTATSSGPRRHTTDCCEAARSVIQLSQMGRYYQFELRGSSRRHRKLPCE